MNYQHILMVTDLKNDAKLVAEKAKNIFNSQEKAQLSVLHIVQDSMVGFGYELIPAASLYEVDDDRRNEAKVALADFLIENKLSAEHAEVTTAFSNSEGIVNYCNSHNVDLLIIGRHERHGLSALINGSTVDSIIADVKCDILVVHLDKA